MTTKQFSILLLVIVLCVVIVAYAQSYGSVSFGPIAPAVANCPAGVAGSATLCAVGTAAPFTMYVSYNGGAYQPLVGAPAAGVTSFNGRTGAVVPAAGDYVFAQISGTAASSQLPALVNSFNGRTGNVLLTDPDITATGLKVTTTVTSTATSSVQ